MANNQNRRRANQEAVRLIKHVRDLAQPQPGESMLRKARACQMKLSRIIYQLENRPAEVEGMPTNLETAMLGLQESLSELLDPYGYCLFVFEIGEDSRLSWTTNANANDVAELLGAFIEAHGK